MCCDLFVSLLVFVCNFFMCVREISPRRQADHGWPQSLFCWLVAWSEYSPCKVENFAYCPLFRQLVCTSICAVTLVCTSLCAVPLVCTSLFIIDDQRQPHAALGATPWKWRSLGGGPQHYATGLIFTLFVIPILCLCLVRVLICQSYPYPLPVFA